MSVRIWIELERSGDCHLPSEMAERGSTYGTNVAREIRYLDEICSTLGSETFGQFVADADSVEGEDGEPRRDIGSWFEPRQVRPVVQALVEHLESLESEAPEFGDVTSTRDPKYLLWDLEAFQRILADAVRQKERCRFLIG